MSAAAKRGPEPWAWVAFAVGIATAVGFAILGARPGGRLPMVVYSQASAWLALAAFAVFLVGGLWSATHRPLLQRRRLLAFVVLSSTVMVVSAPIPYPSSFERHPSRAEVELPVEGEWTVRWGGDRGKLNPFVTTPDRRWSLHLVVTDEEGRTAAAEATAPEDFPAFGREVRAPLDAVVAAVHDGEPDRARGAPPGADPYGNWVALEVGEGEYLFLTSLQEGSVAVAPGAAVARGDRLGLVGASATSPPTPEPHLALHLQASPEPRMAEAIPWDLHRYLVDGREVARGRPTGGLRAGGFHPGEEISRATPFPD